MKKTYTILLICIITMISCQKSPSYRIIGTVDNIPNGDTILLQEYKDGQMIKLNMAIVKDGSFLFKGEQDSIVNRYITYMKNDKRYFTDFFLSNNEIEITLGPTSRIGGTEINDNYQKFKDNFISINNDLNQMYMKSKIDTTLSDMDKSILLNNIHEKDSLGMVMVYNTIYDNISNPLGIYLLPQFASAFDLDKQKGLINMIPQKYMNIPSILKLKHEIEKIKNSSVGERYINFTMTTPEGEKINLSDIVSANKYTLIDFWASWCKPCINEIPSLIEFYKDYKYKGIQILGVSLDENANSWKNMIDKMEMTWPQVSDLKGWNNSAAKLYGVNSIPTTILINQEGIIVARNLRGEGIKEKIDELLISLDDDLLQ